MTAKHVETTVIELLELSKSRVVVTDGVKMLALADLINVLNATVKRLAAERDEATKERDEAIRERDAIVAAVESGEVGHDDEEGYWVACHPQGWKRFESLREAVAYHTSAGSDTEGEEK